MRGDERRGNEAMEEWDLFKVVNISEQNSFPHAPPKSDRHEVEEK